MEKIFYIYFLLSSMIFVISALQKRALVVPPTSPTRHQLISGIGIPLSLKDEAITLGLVMKAQYYLPETVNQLKFTFFPDIWAPFSRDNNSDEVWHVFPNGRRRREILTDPMTGQKYEKYDIDVQEIKNDPLDMTTKQSEYWDAVEKDDEDFDDQFEEDIQDRKALHDFYSHQQQQQQRDDKQNDGLDLSTSRWVAYDTLSSMLDSKGFNGRKCVLRGICEAAEVEFSDHLMAELFHIFFTPSTTSEPSRKSSDNDYISAENIGRDETEPDCAKVYPDCERSIMEIFTEVYDNKMFQFY